MSNRDSKDTVVEKNLQAEKATILNMQKDLTQQHKRTKKQVYDIHYELTKKEILLENQTMEESQKCMLKYDLTLSRRELERVIYQKEILKKDLTILQTRLKHIENEIRKRKSIWQRLFNIEK
jgi:hypothetical protein